MDDRELDIAIAEKLFGITKIFKPSDYADYSSAALFGSDEPSWIPSGKSPRTHMIDARPIPNFSINIWSAMEVVEKMRERLAAEGFPSIRLETPIDSVKWSVRFGVGFNIGGTQVKGYAQHESLPRAICEAALKAIEG